MDGFITNEGKAYAQGQRDNGDQGAFVLDARGVFVPADTIHLPMMFQFTREQVEFNGWDEMQITENALALAAEHRLVTLFPALIDQTLTASLRMDLMVEINSQLDDAALNEKFISRLTKAHANSQPQTPLFPRDAWNYEEALQIAQSAGADHIVQLFTQLREKNVL